MSHGYTWSPDTLSLCAARNLLPMVRLLHERGCTTWGAAAKQAAHNDDLELFAFALEREAAGLVNYEHHSLVAYKQKWACFLVCLGAQHRLFSRHGYGGRCTLPAGAQVPA
jgi:hypothetical protein